MCNVIYHQPKRLFARTTEKRVYASPVVFLVLGWFVLSTAIAVLLVASFIPGHLGLSDLLQAMGDLLPADPVSYTT